MNIKTRNSLLLIFVILLYSCEGSGNKRYSGHERIITAKDLKEVAGQPDREIIHLQIPPIEKSGFDYNKMLDSIQFIKLETIPASIIGTIDRIFFTPDKIIIVDFKITESVFIFNLQGHFINKISATKKRANGNNDLTNFFDVAYYSNADEIILHDNRKSKLYYFDSNGKYRRTEKEYVSFFSFGNLIGTENFVYLDLYTRNDHIQKLLKTDLYLGTKDTRITFIAPNAVQTTKIIDKYHYTDNLSSHNSFQKIFYTPVFSDTIYEIDGRSLNVYPKVVLHFPGPGIVEKIKENTKINTEDLNKLYNSHQYFSFQGKILYSQDSVYFIGCRKDDLLGYFYSEKSKKLIGGPIRSIFSSKDSSQIEDFQYPVATFNKYFVSLIQSSDLTGMTNTLASSKLSNVIKESKSNDNPILVLYKLKNF